MRPEVLAQLVSRMATVNNSDTPSAIPPRRTIPTGSRFEVIRTVPAVGGQYVTLVWLHPQGVSPKDLSHFEVYATGHRAGSNEPQSVGTAIGSPAQVRLTADQTGVATFYLQTVLRNGMRSKIEHSPTCTVVVTADTL